MSNITQQAEEKDNMQHKLKIAELQMQINLLKKQDTCIHDFVHSTSPAGRSCRIYCKKCGLEVYLQ